MWMKRTSSNSSKDLLKTLMREILGIEKPPDFPRLTYAEAMDRFGTDRPDTRFGMELRDVSEVFKDSEFKVFAGKVREGGVVKAINAKGCANFSRKVLDELGALAAEFGAKGLAWAKATAEGWQSPIGKFLTDAEKERVSSILELEQGDLALFVADSKAVAANVLGRLRLELAQRLGLLEPDDFRFLWVTHFPLLEYDEEESRYVAVHHPFTAPLEGGSAASEGAARGRPVPRL